MKLRPATLEDAAAIALIYAPYVTESAVSFETDPPDEQEMRARIQAVENLYPWIVAVGEDGAIAGYAYASAFRPRPAYRYAVETSVYLAGDRHGRGIGSRLYRSLLDTLEVQGYAQAVAALTLPNPASVRLHEALGFTPRGRLPTDRVEEGGLARCRPVAKAACARNRSAGRAEEPFKDRAAPRSAVAIDALLHHRRR